MAKGTKTGGRQKGTLNKVKQTLQDKAEELGCDPFEILLLFAKEDWKRLGYDARTKVSYTNAGIEFEEYIIPPALRQKAAAEACQYMLPKRKAIETTLDPAVAERLKQMEGMSEDQLRELARPILEKK